MVTKSIRGPRGGSGGSNGLNWDDIITVLLILMAAVNTWILNSDLVPLSSHLQQHVYTKICERKEENSQDLEVAANLSSRPTFTQKPSDASTFLDLIYEKVAACGA